MTLPQWRVQNPETDFDQSLCRVHADGFRDLLFLVRNRVMSGRLQAVTPEQAQSPARFTVSYWECMGRHYDLLRDYRRVKFPISNVTKMREKPNDLAEISSRVTALRANWGGSE